MSPIEFRRELHRHPELSFAEYNTAEFIESALAAEGIACRRVADTGVLAVLEGRGDTKRAVVLRADIDALPITEATGLEYASENEGVMHACGHDMHAAVLFGALQRLSRERNFEGTIFGLFQPGEECTPGGASKVLADNHLRVTMWLRLLEIIQTLPLRWVRLACVRGHLWRRMTS